MSSLFAEPKLYTCFRYTYILFIAPFNDLVCYHIITREYYVINFKLITHGQSRHNKLIISEINDMLLFPLVKCKLRVCFQWMFTTCVSEHARRLFESCWNSRLLFFAKLFNDLYKIFKRAEIIIHKTLSLFCLLINGDR